LEIYQNEYREIIPYC